VPLIKDAKKTYPNGLPAYLKGVDLCWTSATTACGTSNGASSSNLTVLDSGAPAPFIVPGNDIGMQLTNISIASPPPPPSPGNQTVWSFPVTSSVSEYDAQYTNSTTTGAFTGFNTGIGFFYFNAVGWDVKDGQVQITPTPPAPPSATIAAPADDQTYTVGQSVQTSFSCQEGAGGPGLDSCTDSNGANAAAAGSATATGTGKLNTATAGLFSYTVTAKSYDGLTGSANISYAVVNASPSNRFTVSRVKAFPDGTVVFDVKVPGRGTINVLETAWKNNLARAPSCCSRPAAGSCSRAPT
jgi:hypothetical protein